MYLILKKLVIGFYVFAIVTFGILMAMDVMECFLHTLRLHWYSFFFCFVFCNNDLFKCKIKRVEF